MTPADALDPVGRLTELADVVEGLVFSKQHSHVELALDVAEQAVADLRAVLRRLEEAEKDVKRIDWIERQVERESVSLDSWVDALSAHTPPGNVYAVVTERLADVHGFSLRLALDAAIKLDALDAAAAPRPDAGGAG